MLDEVSKFSFTEFKDTKLNTVTSCFSGIVHLLSGILSKAFSTNNMNEACILPNILIRIQIRRPE